MLYFIQVLVAMILAYFIGSILTGVMIGRRTRGLDIRDYGSGNAGATNAMRVLGTKLGLLVLVLDVLKGLLPVLLLPLILGIPHPVPPTVQLLIGTAAVAGGRGVFLAVAPKVMIIVLLIGLIVIGFSGYVSLVSVAAAIIIPYLLWWEGYPWAVIWVAAAVCGFVIYRHEGNILRLLTGKERKVWDSSDKEALPAEIVDPKSAPPPDWLR